MLENPVIREERKPISSPVNTAIIDMDAEFYEQFRLANEQIAVKSREEFKLKEEVRNARNQAS